MRFHPASLKPWKRPSDLGRQRLRAGHAMRRGVNAKRGFVAWNQPAEDRSIHNTCRPFWDAKDALEWAQNFDPEGDGAYLPLLGWMRLVDKKRDWREVQMEKVLELERLAERLRQMARWMLGDGEESGAIRPVGEEKPSARGAVGFLVGCAGIIKATTIAKRRIEETERAADRRRAYVRELVDAVDEEALDREAAAWAVKNKVG